MTEVTVTIHDEDPTQSWAESDDVPGWTAWAGDLADLFDLIVPGIQEHLGTSDIDVRMRFAERTETVVAFTAAPTLFSAVKFVGSATRTAAVARTSGTLEFASSQ